MGVITGPSSVGAGGTTIATPKNTKSITTDTPGAPSEGDIYIVPVGATGAFSGHDNEIATYTSSGWEFVAAVESALAYVDDSDDYYVFTGSAWKEQQTGSVIHAMGGAHHSADTLANVNTKISDATLDDAGDPRDPNAHAASHADGGTDEITPLAIGAKDLNGFPNRVDSSIAMNGADLEISGSYSFFSGGNKFTKSGTDAVTISSDQDLTYVYYDSSGVLQKSTSLWDIVSDNVLVATVYKDSAIYIVTDERHSANRDRDWHNWAHNTIGARYGSGLTGTFLDSTFSIAQGIVADEDIFFDTGGAETTCQLWYRNSGPTAMRVESGVATPYKAITGVIQYDNAGTLTGVDNNKYVNSYVYATNGDEPIVILVGQGQHTNIVGARNEAFPSILLSTAEWKLLYRVTYKNVGGTPTYQEAVDFRLVSSGPAIDAGSTDHAGLTGRDALNQHPASAIAPDVSAFGGILSASDDTVQKALDTLDNHAADHQSGGADEVATVTPASGAIPKADGTGKLPIGFMPAAVVGGVNYQGTWNASTNTPALADGTGTQGHYYVVDTAGSQDLGSGTIAFNIGDWCIHNGSIYEKVDHTDAVTSVFTRTGAITAQSGDYDHSELGSVSADQHHTEDHAARHQNGGADEISVAGLSGELADDQPPKAHTLGGSAHSADTLANLNAKVSDATLIAAWDESQAYYVAKHGHDTNNDGKSPDAPFLTIGKAITAIGLLTPSTSNRFIIKVMDAGIYTENLTMPVFTHIEAPGAKLVGQVDLNDFSSIHFNEIDGNGEASAVASTPTPSTGQTFVKANKITNSGNAIHLTFGMIFIDVDEVEGSVGLLLALTTGTGGAFGRIGKLTGSTNAINDQSQAAATQESALCISEIVGTTNGINQGLNPSVLNVFAMSLTGGTCAYNLTNAGSILNLIVGDISGAETVSAGTANVTKAGVGATEAIILAASDEVSDLTTGTAKVTFRMPYAFTLSEVRASVTTAPTGSVLTVDINEGGTTVLSTKLTIDAGEKTSTTAATPAVISDAALADDAEMTIDIDGIGSTIAGAGLKVTLIGVPA